MANGFLDPATMVKQFEARLPIVPILFRTLQVWHRSDIRGLGFDASGRIGFADAFFYGAPRKNTRGKQP
jgi:hypothetical protein